MEDIELGERAGEMERELLSLLGIEKMVAFLEIRAGTRVFFPTGEHRCKQKSFGEIVDAIGEDAAAALCDRYSPDYIKIPLCRELRSKYYRRAGRSNAWIAVKLGMTETGVERIFRRVAGEACERAVGDGV